MIWDKEWECISRAELRHVQLKRLQGTVRQVYDALPFYRQRFEECDVRPDDIQSLDDIRRLPFMGKNDLRDHFPFGLFTRPLRDVVRIHASSGTTGLPTVVGYTRRDLDTWADLVARVATAAGVTADDIAQVSFGYGLFTGAFGLHHGLERIGAAVLPVSSGNTERQVQLMQMFGPTVLICTPSYALHIGEVAAELGVRPSDLSLRLGLFGAEPWSDSMRREIEGKLGITAMDNYGLSEVMGPGVSGECERRDGLHINEDHFLVEVLDPRTMEPVAEGEMGELVFTSLSKEAFPIIRYRSRDLSRLTFDPCACGRTTARMQRVTGRTDDMLIVRGVNVFPSQIESVLLDIEGTEPHYQITIDRHGALDDISLEVEVAEAVFSGEAKRLHSLREQIQRKLLSVLGINVDVHLAEPRSIERSEGKAKRVIDKRLQ